MSSKINLSNIISDNFLTYTNDKGEVEYLDWLILVVMPILFGVIFTVIDISFNEDFFTNIVTTSALFSGLLLNLLVLVYDQKIKHIDLDIKGDDPRYQMYVIRRRIIGEVHTNISYSILISLLLLIFSIIGSNDIFYVLNFYGCNISLHKILVIFPIIFLCTHVALTILMILKRVYKLIDSH